MSQVYSNEDKIMTLVLEWPCYRCGIPLSEKDYLITRKYCAKCKEDIRKEKYTRSNHKRAYERELNRLKINLVKS